MLFPKHRVGFIRVTRLVWEQRADEIKKSIGETNIQQISQSVQNGGYLDAVDVIFENPEFEKISWGDEIPQYAYDFDSYKLIAKKIQP